MTAINIIRKHNAVHLITNGAVVAIGGDIMEFAAPKAILLPHLNAVAAVRGSRVLGPVLADFVGAAGPTYDKMKSSLLPALQRYCEPAKKLWDDTLGPDGSKFDLVIGGISDRGTDSFFITSYSAHGVAPWTIIQLGPLSFVPGTPAMLSASGSADSFNPVTDGLRIVEAQRMMKFAHGPRGVERHIVGGFAQLTTVTCDYIETRILKRWPDIPGMAISPDVAQQELVT